MRKLAYRLGGPLYLALVSPLVLTSGCWDFESLAANAPIIVPDGGDGGGNVSCDKVPNGLQEDCADPTADVNNNCLPGCMDATCRYHTACLPGYRAAGSVNANMNANMNACTVVVPVYQNLTTPDPCAACACGAGECSATLKVFNDLATCTANGNAPTMVSVRVTTNAASRCPAVANTMNTSMFRMPALAPTCAPTQAMITGAPQWGTTSYLCQTSMTKTQTLADLIGNNACVLFDGDVACPDFTDRNGVGFTKKQLYYEGTSGTSQCTCSCTPSANACQVAAGDLKLTDSTTCATGSGVKTTNLPADMCTASTDAAMMTYAVKALQVANTVAPPTCTKGGTASGQFAPRGPVTACCK
jgi:hypothetical protein